jgi:hypothetical protein
MKEYVKVTLTNQYNFNNNEENNNVAPRFKYPIEILLMRV